MNRPLALAIVVSVAACGGRTGLSGALPTVADASANAPEAGATADASLTPPPEAGFDAATPPALCAPISGLLAYYPLDLDLGDHSGNGHDAMGSVVLIPAGKVGGAAAFDGVSSVLRATGGAALPSSRTFCAWVDTEPRAGLGQPLFSAGAVRVGDFLSISASSPSGGTCPFLLPNTLFVDHWGTPCFNAPGLQAQVGAWHLVCYADDGAGTLTFYADTQSGTTAGGEYSYAFGTLYFGSTAIGGTTTQTSLLGVLDEITVWARALDAADFAALWNDGNGCGVR